MSKYGVFWNDYNMDEDSYIKLIQDVCGKCMQQEASETETRELISFFGRCYSNIRWQDTVRIFSGSVIRKLMETNGSEMRLAVIPALRTDFDRTRTIVLYGSAALPKDNTAPEEWVNMSKPISVWDRNGDYAPEFVKQYNFDMDAYIGDFRKQDKQKACSLELRLANSIATLMWRTEASDVLELWAIAKDYNDSFNDILEQAEQIEPGTEVRYLVNKILSMPKALFDSFSWENKPDYSEFICDMEHIADRLFNLTNGGLAMDDELFEELVTSIKQAIAIEKGELKPSRVFEYSDNKDIGIPNSKIDNGKQVKKKNTTECK